MKTVKELETIPEESIESKEIPMGPNLSENELMKQKLMIFELDNSSAGWMAL